MLSNTPGNDIGEVMAVCEPRLKECQELPEHRRIPRGQARQQRVERPDPGSQTGLPSNPDCATSQITWLWFCCPASESVSSQEQPVRGRNDAYLKGKWEPEIK